MGLILFVSTCKENVEVPELTLNEKLEFDQSAYTTYLKNYFLSIDGYILQQDSLLTYYDTLKYFYSLRDFEPLFVKSFEDNNKVYSFISIIENVNDHGLIPEQYHFTKIINEFNQATDTLPNESRYYHLALTELLLSDAVLKYSQHLRYGVVNPKEIFSDSYFLPVDDSSKGDLLKPLREENLVGYLNGIQPKSKRYMQLQSALKHYTNLVGKSWPEIKLAVNKIEYGTESSSLPLIIDRLVALEYIDTSLVTISNPFLYDSLIFKTVQRFQRDNGLNDDGVIGANTIARLNVTPEQYVNTIKLNLERFRWIEYPDTSQFILVNIPDFRLYIFDEGREIFESKVCTGSKRPSYYKAKYEKYLETKLWSDKPDDWETPNMYGKISYMVLNPTWNVPQSIMREEIVYKMKRDSSYLRDHNFKVFLDTLELDPDSITINDLTVEKVPYKIIQNPGVGNALGKIKFIFYNRFGIYLHDTPNRGAFNRDNRAVSHGCVRVENPIPLAEFFLKDHPKWKIDYLKYEIGLKVEDKAIVEEYTKKRESLRKYASLGPTTDVMLSKKVPLYIDYYTAWVDEEGIVNFRDDVYDRDKVLLEYLSANHLL